MSSNPPQPSAVQIVPIAENLRTFKPFAAGLLSTHTHAHRTRRCSPPEHKYSRTHTHSQSRTHKHTHSRAHSCTHSHADIRTRTHTHTEAHTHSRFLTHTMTHIQPSADALNARQCEEKVELRNDEIGREARSGKRNARAPNPNEG